MKNIEKIQNILKNIKEIKNYLNTIPYDRQLIKRIIDPDRLKIYELIKINNLFYKYNIFHNFENTNLYLVRFSDSYLYNFYNNILEYMEINNQHDEYLKLLNYLTKGKIHYIIYNIEDYNIIYCKFSINNKMKIYDMDNEYSYPNENSDRYDKEYLNSITDRIEKKNEFLNSVTFIYKGEYITSTIKSGTFYYNPYSNNDSITQYKIWFDIDVSNESYPYIYLLDKLIELGDNLINKSDNLLHEIWYCIKFGNDIDKYNKTKMFIYLRRIYDRNSINEYVGILKAVLKILNIFYFNIGNSSIRGSKSITTNINKLETNRIKSLLISNDEIMKNITYN